MDWSSLQQGKVRIIDGMQIYPCHEMGVRIFPKKHVEYFNSANFTSQWYPKQDKNPV